MATELPPIDDRNESNSAEALLPLTDPTLGVKDKEYGT